MKLREEEEEYEEEEEEYEEGNMNVLWGRELKLCACGGFVERESLCPHTASKSFAI